MKYLRSVITCGALSLLLGSCTTGNDCGNDGPNIAKRFSDTTKIEARYDTVHFFASAHYADTTLYTVRTVANLRDSFRVIWSVNGIALRGDTVVANNHWQWYHDSVVEMLDLQSSSRGPSVRQTASSIIPVERDSALCTPISDEFIIDTVVFETPPNVTILPYEDLRWRRF